MQKPKARIVSSESQSDITRIGKHDCVLVGWKFEFLVGNRSRRFDLLHCHVGWQQAGIDNVELVR